MQRGVLLTFFRRNRTCRHSASAAERFFEGVTAVQMTVLTEVIVDRGVDGGELLKSLGTSEFCQCSRPARRAGGRS